MKKIRIVAVIAVCLFGLNGWATKPDTLKQRPGQVSFFYPLGTNGLNSAEYSNNVSLNILWGINGGLNGLEFGGLVNTNLGNVTGAQFAGIANINAGTTNGIIFGGITNIIKDSSNTVCFAGISNVLGKSTTGIQFAGISNTVNGSVTGAQFAGISNTTNGDVNGMQAAGISNINNGDFLGLQIAGISNVTTGKLNGAQIGLINTARTINGCQFGLINVAENFEKGVPIGLISFVKDGYHAIELSANEAIYANLSLKLGVEKFYTSFKGGYTSGASDQYFTYGMGVGSMFPVTEKTRVGLELSSNHIVESTFSPRLNLLNRADFTFRYRLGEYLEFSAGPSFNVYVSEHLVDSPNSVLDVPYAVYEEDWWNGEGSTSMWIGGNVGVSVLF